MLAFSYADHQKKISFPVFVQPKLDGYRAIFYDGNLYSRTGKLFNVPIISDKLRKHIPNDVILDGELYNHDGSFEDLGSIRSLSESNVSSDIKYYVYDLVLPDNSYRDRLAILHQLDETVFKNLSHVFIVDTFEATNQKQIKEFHTRFVSNGFEGLMIRIPDSLYKIGARSKHLLKMKVFDDDEFKVVDFDKDIDGCVIWICETKSGQRFRVPCSGNKDACRQLYIDGDKYLGKLFSVKYFGFTNSDSPRFPKALRPGTSGFRDE
jgi:ATP-dependent DNA ligase